MKTIRLNGFTEVHLDKIRINRMQVGDVNAVHSLDDEINFQPELTISITKMENYQYYSRFFRSNKAGYFQEGTTLYYRNCNLIANASGGEVFYKGRLPYSLLYTRISIEENIKVEFIVTENFLIESRCRLTKNSAFEELVNKVILFCSILLDKIPLHAAAIALDRFHSMIFMGLTQVGKTTTSLKVASLLNQKYLSEDIVFVDVKTLAVYTAPFTSYNIRPRSLKGPKLKYIACQYRDLYPSRAKPINDNRLLRSFIRNINTQQIEWQRNCIALGLLGAPCNFFGESILSYDYIQKKYYSGVNLITSQARGIEVGGNNPSEWPGLIVQFLASHTRDSMNVSQSLGRI